MRDFKRKKGIRWILESKLVLFILFGITVFFAWNIANLVGKMNETKENRQIAENKITELTSMKNQLSGDISSLSTEVGKEESIREKFGWAKEGEGVIVIIEEKEEDNLKKEEKNQRGFFGWLKDIFK